jgi:hypothetical protein
LRLCVKCFCSFRDFFFRRRMATCRFFHGTESSRRAACGHGGFPLLLGVRTSRRSIRRARVIVWARCSQAGLMLWVNLM